MELQNFLFQEVKIPIVPVWEKSVSLDSWKVNIAPNQTIQHITGKSIEAGKFSGLVSVTEVVHFVLKSV